MENIFYGGSGILAGTKGGLEHLDLLLYKATGSEEVGEEVVWLICWHCRNCLKSLDTKGGPLLV